MLCPNSVLITGANRGIGLEFVKHFLQLSKPPSHVFAGCRTPSEAKDLQKLADTNLTVHIVKLDVTDQSSIDEVKGMVASKVGSEGLTLLLNNAGCYKKLNLLEDHSTEDFMTTYKTNVVGPAMICKAFLPLLKMAAKNRRIKGMSCNKAAVINVSGFMGSIAENSDGRSYAYRASKAALNQINKCLSLELKTDDILVIVMHPGWVKTEMGGPDALITTEESVQGCFKVFSGLNEESTGKFYHCQGGEIAW